MITYWASRKKNHRTSSYTLNHVPMSRSLTCASRIPLLALLALLLVAIGREDDGHKRRPCIIFLKKGTWNWGWADDLLNELDKCFSKVNRICRDDICGHYEIMRCGTKSDEGMNTPATSSPRPSKDRTESHRIPTACPRSTRARPWPPHRYVVRASRRRSE